MTRPQRSAAPVVAQYVATFLKPEMWHIYRQIRALEAFRPVVICQKRENAAEFPWEDLVVCPKPATHQLRRFWQKSVRGEPITIYRSEARRLVEELRVMEARALHVYFGHIAVYLLPLLEIAPVPVVVSFHGADARIESEGPVYAARMRRVLEKATLVLARSESLLEGLAAFGADPSKLRVQRTGIPLPERPPPSRQPPADGVWRLLQACRLIEKKGLPTTLRAFAEFHRDFSQSTLTIAGEGPLLESLRHLAAELGVAAAVRFTGFLSQADLQAEMARAHLFVHPSETVDGDQEGVPNSLLEAMALALPVVATRHGGIPEAVESGRSGLLVPERDPAALTAALRELAHNEAQWSRLSAEGASRVREMFDQTTQARRLEALYREAIARPGIH